MEKGKFFILLALFLIGTVSAIPPLVTWEDEVDSHRNEEEIIPFYRLPENTIAPISYDLTIRPIIDEENSFGTRFTAPGTNRIKFSCLTNTSNVIINAATITFVSNLYITEACGQAICRRINIATRFYDENRQLFYINVRESLVEGMEYNLVIDFVARIPNDRMDGLYRSSYRDENGVTRYLVATDFEPADARRAFPCFDEPQYKATWKISIIRQKGYHSLSNMDLIEIQKEVIGFPGWEKDIYRESPKMSSYLVCFAVTDYLSEKAPEGLYRLPFEIWGPPPIMRQGGGVYSAKVTPQIMKALEDHYGVNYTFPKMDKIAIPDFSAGAMENWGLNTYREARLMWVEGVSTWADRVAMTSTLSHELVHQWYGNLVTMKWWNDIWLNEGFATFYAPYGVNAVHPEYRLKESFIFNGVQHAMQFDMSERTHPMSQAPESIITPEQSAGLFTAIVYQKGGSIIRMMESFLGEDNLRNAFQDYLEEFEYDNAAQDDLFAVLQRKVVQESLLPPQFTVKNIMDTYTKQTGFPVLNVTRSFGGSNMAKFQQSSYTLNLKDDEVPNKLWYVPITHIVEGVENSNGRPQWLGLVQEIDLPLDGLTDVKWVLINPETKGYYRVLYDEGNFQLLINQLKTNHLAIDESSRSYLVDDCLNLAYAGYKDLPSSLELVEYLKNERRLSPWVTFVTNFATPHRMLSRGSVFPGQRKFLLDLMKDTLNEIGFNYRDGDLTNVGDTILLRNRLVDWACNMGDKDCLNFAKTNMREWMDNPSDPSIVFPDLQPIVYCHAIAAGEDDIWDFVLKQYETFDRHLLPDTMRLNLLRSLACSRQHYKLQRLLEMATDLTSVIRSSHRITAIQAVAGNSIGTDLTFSFIRNHVKLIVNRFGSSIISNSMSTLSSYLNTPTELIDFNNFVTVNEDLLISERNSLEASKRNIERNIVWMTNHQNNFKMFYATKNN